MEGEVSKISAAMWEVMKVVQLRVDGVLSLKTQIIWLKHPWIAEKVRTLLSDMTAIYRANVLQCYHDWFWSILWNIGMVDQQPVRIFQNWLTSIRHIWQLINLLTPHDPSVVYVEVSKPQAGWAIVDIKYRILRYWHVRGRPER